MTKVKCVILQVVDEDGMIQTLEQSFDTADKARDYLATEMPNVEQYYTITIYEDGTVSDRYSLESTIEDDTDLPLGDDQMMTAYPIGALVRRYWCEPGADDASVIGPSVNGLTPVSDLATGQRQQWTNSTFCLSVPAMYLWPPQTVSDSATSQSDIREAVRRLRADLDSLDRLLDGSDN